MPSVEEFGDAFFDAEPVLIKGGVSHWPALTRWLDKEYLRRIAGKATVPVEIGGSYLSSEMHRADMPLALYLDYLAAAADGTAQVQPWPRPPKYWQHCCSWPVAVRHIWQFAWLPMQVRQQMWAAHTHAVRRAWVGEARAGRRARAGGLGRLAGKCKKYGRHQ